MSTRTGKMLLFGATTTLGWRVVRMVSFAEGEKRAGRGSVRRVYDEVTNEHIGYQLVSSHEQRGDRDLRSQPSTASISMREMQLNAERSRTVGLTEERRMERVALGLAPEDLVERVQCKVRVFPHIGAAKRDILRVWPR